MNVVILIAKVTETQHELQDTFDAANHILGGVLAEVTRAGGGGIETNGEKKVNSSQPLYVTHLHILLLQRSHD